MEKIRRALRGRGNRTAAVFKLFTGMAQGGRTFDHWHKKIYEAAKQVDWVGYNAETAAMDAIVMQTRSATPYQTLRAPRAAPQVLLLLYLACLE